MNLDLLRQRPTILIRPMWFALVIVAVIATWLALPEWWTWIAPETSLARELSTAMLLTTSGLAGLVWWRRADERAVFGLLAVGFLGLAVDERVAIHERLRDRVLAPRNVTLPFIPWGEPGDIVLVVVAIVGLLLLRFVLGSIVDDGRALPWLVTGVILATTAIGLDTLPIETYQLRYEIWFQSGEEAIELGAAACFVSAMLEVVESRFRRKTPIADVSLTAAVWPPPLTSLQSGTWRARPARVRAPTSRRRHPSRPHREQGVRGRS